MIKKVGEFEFRRVLDDFRPKRRRMCSIFVETLFSRRSKKFRPDNFRFRLKVSALLKNSGSLKLPPDTWAVGDDA